MLLLTRLWLSFTFFFANYAPATSIAFGLHIDIEKRPASAVHHFAPDGDLPEQIKKLADEDLVRLGTLYLRDIRNIAPTAARVTDKMPSNFRFAGLIQLALPNARIIHTRRDPVDTCVSCFSTLFARGQTIAYELGELVATSIDGRHGDPLRQRLTGRCGRWMMDGQNTGFDLAIWAVSVSSIDAVVSGVSELATTERMRHCVEHGSRGPCVT